MFTVDFKSLTTWRAVSQDDADYVIRRFNRSSARLEKSVGLNLRWSPPLRDFQIQLKPRVNRNEGRTSVHPPRAGWFLVTRGTGLWL